MRAAPLLIRRRFCAPANSAQYSRTLADLSGEIVFLWYGGSQRWWG